LHALLGYPDVADGELTQALARFREAGDLLGEAHALSGLAHLYRQTNRGDLAATTLEAAAKLYGQAGHLRGEADSFRELAKLTLAQGRVDPARGHFLRAADLYGRAGATDFQRKATKEAQSLGH
jgi:tetratricopeptide (TPR) repeat protein